MSTREYIGARYVPTFGRRDEDTIAWDNTAAYEPLTVVLYQGNSYTSRQYVPAGIEINNEEYWALTGNYNAQVESYRQEVADYADEVETFDSRIDTLEEDSAIKKTDIIVIGDSYNIYSANSEGTVINSGAMLWDMVHDATGLTIHNFANGGAGFINTNYTPRTFYVQLGEAIADTSIDADKVKMIVVYGGTNDYSQAENAVSTWQSAIADFMMYKSNSRFAEIPMAIIFNQAGRGHHFDIILAAMFKARVTAASAYTTLYNGAYWMRGYSTLGSDNVHPNRLGYRSIAQFMTAIVQELPLPNFMGAHTDDTTLPSGLTLRNKTIFIQDGILKGCIELKITGGTAIEDAIIPLLNIEECSTAKIISRNVFPSSTSFANSLDAAGIALTFTTQTTSDNYSLVPCLHIRGANPNTLTNNPIFYVMFEAVL